MNIQQARQIPLAMVVEYLGGRFSHHGRKGEAWYFSPFRPDETTASFIVHETTNKWHDFARSEKKDAHGDVIDLWADYHDLPRKENGTIREVLKGIGECFGGMNFSPTKTRPGNRAGRKPVVKETQPRYTLVNQPGRIWALSLKAELSRRRLSLSVVAPYLKQAYIEDKKTQKRFNAFAFANDKGGWEISTHNPQTGHAFKNCLGTKAVTSFVPEQAKTVLVYESRWDFLTWLEMAKGETKNYGFIVANGAGMGFSVVEILTDKIGFVEKILVFQHNDPPGEKFVHTLLDGLESAPVTIGTVNDRYRNHKDLNDWWMQMPAARETDKRVSPKPTQGYEI